MDLSEWTERRRLRRSRVPAQAHSDSPRLAPGIPGFILAITSG